MLTRFSHSIALLLVLAVSAAVRAEQAAAATPPAPLTPVDLLRWRTIEAATLSNDGTWFAYRFRPVQGDSTVIVRRTADKMERKFEIGEMPLPPLPTPGATESVSSGALSFSEDGKWLAFTTFPTRKEAAALRKQRKPIQSGARLVNLETGATVDYPAVRRFAWSGESARAIAFHRYGVEAGPMVTAPGGPGGAGAADRPKGADLIVRDLATGNELTMGGVSEFSFDKPGRWLAWTIDVQEKVGNGVSVRDLETGVVTPLVSARAVFEKPTWNEAGDALAVLQGQDNKAYETKLYVVVGATFEGAKPTVTSYDPAKDKAFPTGMTISGNRAPQWTEDRSGLLFGIVEAKKKAAGGAADRPGADAEKTETAPKPADDDEKPNLVIWHWQDARLQSQQIVQESVDKRFSYLATYRVAEAKFIRLADEALREVTLPRRGRWALGLDRAPYELAGALNGRVHHDLFAVDLHTGERKPVEKEVRWQYGISPDGGKLIYFKAGHFYVYDAEAARSTNITQAVPVSFLDLDSDRDVEAPPVRPVGWAADSASVLLSDRFDVWQVPAAGGPGVNLTGNGQPDQIRYRRVQVDRDEKGIDLKVPLYFEMLGEWTKKTGLARWEPTTRKLEVLAWADAGFGRLLKAERADTLVYTREGFATYPDYHVGRGRASDSRQLTQGQAQLQDKAWSGGTGLIDYVSAAPAGATKGKKLQAALFLPAGYEPGKKYPTIVLIYEQLSDGLNRFTHPATGGFNKAYYTSNGYAVLMPDISYNLDDPGMSALWCVLPALQAAAATGVVDEARVGLHGHSWGGYQTSFLITQTKAFKAAVAGAPLTNLVSMYSLIYKRTGGGNMPIFESSQGRFRSGYSERWEAYIRNSPVAHVSQVSTPLLLLHNDKDDAVDYTQGLEYYSALRRLNQPVVLLEYPGEPHSLRQPANKLDYTIRMREFFDHHLKGAPAPDWWSKGVKRIEMPEHLKARKLPGADAPPAAKKAAPTKPPGPAKMSLNK